MVLRITEKDRSTTYQKSFKMAKKIAVNGERLI